MKREKTFQVLDLDGRVVGTVWGCSLKRLDGDAEASKYVIVCDKDGGHIMTCWHGCKEFSLDVPEVAESDPLYIEPIAGEVLEPEMP